jgi:hypothetical protein
MGVRSCRFEVKKEIPVTDSALRRSRPKKAPRMEPQSWPESAPKRGRRLTPPAARLCALPAA